MSPLRREVRQEMADLSRGALATLSREIARRLKNGDFQTVHVGLEDNSVEFIDIDVRDVDEPTDW
jgi:hypothetical protein